MNYTQNYHLPQWALNDRIMMDDFNQMCAGIEAGLNSNAQAAADAKATAEQTASTAYSPSNKPFAVGRYNGSQAAQTITLGFRPSFVIICGTAVSSGDIWLNAYTAITGGNAFSGVVSFTSSGFTVKPAEDNQHPQLVYGRTYDYIAFR